MGLLIIRHKVSNFAKWKKFFDGHAAAQKACGLTRPRIYRSAGDKNEIIVILQMKDVRLAKTFGASPDLKSTMEAAGVIDQPTVYMVNEA